jgi:putative sigma-54 modulation protein
MEVKMQISITGRHMEVTPALKAHVESHLSKLNRYANHIIKAHVILEIEKFRHIAEFTLSLKKQIMKVRESTLDMYDSVDLAIKKLTQRLKRFEEKIKTHRVKKGI